MARERVVGRQARDGKRVLIGDTYRAWRGGREGAEEVAVGGDGVALEQLLAEEFGVVVGGG